MIIGDAVTEWESKSQEIFGGPVKTLVFTATVAAGSEVCESFQRAGHDFRQVSYLDRDHDKRAELIERFRSGDVMGLVSCEALAKGFDVPDVRILVDMRPLRRSLTAHVQKVGRLLRPAPGKEFGVLIDCTGNWLGFRDQLMDFFEHGCDEIDSQTLTKAKRKDKDKKDWTCGGCGLVLEKAARVCPSCGHARTRFVEQEIRPGIFEEVDWVTGEGTGRPSDTEKLWEQFSRIASRTCRYHDASAEKMARAKFMGAMGWWPDKQSWPFKRDNSKPDPSYESLSDEGYRRWLQTKGRKARYA